MEQNIFLIEIRSLKTINIKLSSSSYRQSQQRAHSIPYLYNKPVPTLLPTTIFPLSLLISFFPLFFLTY